MQNPLRRPGTNASHHASHNASHRNRDLERNRQDKNNDGYLPKDYRAHLVAMSGEFVGTFMFLFFALGTRKRPV